MVTTQLTSVAATQGLISALLLGPYVIGLLIYIYALCFHAQQRRTFGQSLLWLIRQKDGDLQGVQFTHPCLFVLLILDAITAISGICLGILTLASLCFDLQDIGFNIFGTLWVVFRWLSVSQHFIMALTFILFNSSPEWGSSLLTVSNLLNLPPFFSVMAVLQGYDCFRIGLDVYNLLLTLTIVVSCLLNASSIMAEQRKSIGLLAVVMYCFSLPNSVLDCMMFHSGKYLPFNVDVLYVTNVYFIMNALLFYFVLKMKEEERHQYEGAIMSA